MVEELRHHGYEISSGTLYPLLHGLEKKGYLTSYYQPTGHRDRRMYEITIEGRQALVEAKIKVTELFGELIEGS
ncbi:PadR family transcriptional regulator [Psychrobacter sp. 4Bb]|nr:PadR family transcriptional regulator [Psychrobacter sp. 4Bb]